MQTNLLAKNIEQMFSEFKNNPTFGNYQKLKNAGIKLYELRKSEWGTVNIVEDDFKDIKDFFLLYSEVNPIPVIFGVGVLR